MLAEEGEQTWTESSQFVRHTIRTTKVCRIFQSRGPPDLL